MFLFEIQREQNYLLINKKYKPVYKQVIFCYLQVTKLLNIWNVKYIFLLSLLFILLNIYLFLTYWPLRGFNFSAGIIES